MWAELWTTLVRLVLCSCASAFCHGKNMPQVSASPGKMKGMQRSSKPSPQVGTKPSQAQPTSVAKPLSTHRCVRKEAFCGSLLSVLQFSVMQQAQHLHLTELPTDRSGGTTWSYIDLWVSEVEVVLEPRKTLTYYFLWHDDQSKRAVPSSPQCAVWRWEQRKPPALVGVQ